MFQSKARPGATPEIVEHALDFSQEVSDLIELYHPNSVPAKKSSIAIAMAMFMLTLDHRQAIMLLVMHGARSSAAALVRPTFEAYFRGEWALKVATEQQINDIFGDNPRIPTLDSVLGQLKRNKATADLAAYDSWKVAGDYVHGGPLQLSRWLGPGGIEPLHSDIDAVEMLDASNFCGLLACIGMNEAREQQPEALVEKLTDLTMRRISRRAADIYFEPLKSNTSEPKN